MFRYGIIGTGNISRAHAEAITHSDKLELVAVAGRNVEKGTQEAEQYHCRYYQNVEEMLDAPDIDAVVITLPTYLHEEYTILAAKHGKDIVCEKPVTMTMESFDRMMAAVKEAGVNFMVAQVVRFWPEYVDIKKRFDAGEFGEIKMIYANRLAQHPNWGAWFYDPEKGGQGLYDMILHDIDFVMYLLGKPKKVYAIGWQNAKGAWDHVIASLTFANGEKACVEGAFDMTDGYPFGMHFRIGGENETVEYDLSAGFNLEDIGGAVRREMLFRTGEAPVKVEVDESIDAYGAELEYFAECVQKGEERKEVTNESVRDVLSVILAMKESLETGKVIDM